MKKNACINRIILSYLSIIIALAIVSPSLSFSYVQPVEAITQYITNISYYISSNITQMNPSGLHLYSQEGNIRLKLLLSPIGELKDVSISNSSGNKELDELCLNAAWLHEKYQPFPEAMGKKDLWIDVPVIFDINNVGVAAQTAFFTGIDGAVDMALINQLGPKIAEKELDLSRLKIREARRALYPAASLNYLETTGTTVGDTQDFTDKEYKLKFEYPLYYGWRLKYAVDQAVSSMKASRENFDEAKQDVQVEVETAFYSYAANRVNLNLQQQLLKEAEGIFATAEKRFDSGLITEAEFLQVSAQLKQVTYQVVSSKNDMDIAELNLAQAMKIKNPEDLSLIFKDQVFLDIPGLGAGPMEIVDIDVSMEECVDIAFRYRPDLRSKKHMVDFNDYERMIALSKDNLKVDLTGSYGKSGGAYESETLELDKDWFIGLKVSKPLGGNTITTSYTKEQTSEKHGQTSRTEALSKSAEFNILDNMQSFSEKKSGDIALYKAKQEFSQVQDTVLKDVKESYLSYKKSIVQEKANRNKIRQREEELKVAKAQAELNEIPLSELMKAHISLTDERLFYVETIGSFYQSLVKLNKATGYALFLDSENFMLANLK